ncbi:unnamed protein product, partial [Brassica oleracea]
LQTHKNCAEYQKGSKVEVSRTEILQRRRLSSLRHRDQRYGNQQVPL